MSSSSYQVLSPVKVGNTVLSDDCDDKTDNEEYYGQCSDDIDSNTPSYYCPCVKGLHVHFAIPHRTSYKETQCIINLQENNTFFNSSNPAQILFISE